MAGDIPYMLSAKNLPAILDKIKSAGTPPRFTHDFLKAHLGFPSSNDRSVIGVLKTLGFLATDSAPTARYNEFRNDQRSGKAMAAGLREGWSDVFLSDEKAFQRTPAELTELFKNVTGKGEAVATKMATTFRVLAAAADWTARQGSPPATAEEAPSPPTAVREAGDELSIGLHHDVHIHLPATSDVAVYTAIFRAIRSELID